MLSLRFGASVKRKVVFGFGVGAALLALVLVSPLRTPVVHAAGDCDSNAIIYCGFGSSSEFISQVRLNDSKNGHHDLQTIYNQYGLSPDEYDRFVKTARPGTLYRDGRLVVDGQTVATGTNIIGRNASAQGAGYFTQNIGGTNYYGNVNDRAFGAGTNSLNALVMFNAQGSAEFSVIKSCGNPIGGETTKPAYSCNVLHMAPVPGKMNTYGFSANVTAQNNASIAKLVYDFGDGSPTQTTTDPAVNVVHTYKKNGKFTAKVTLYVKVPGDQQVAVSAGTCEKVITVVLPYYECLKLSGAIIDSSKYSYKFIATAKSGGGATPVSADFVMGDGKTFAGVKLDKGSANTFTVDYAYKEAGKYSASATLHFSLNGSTVSAPACRAGVTPTTPPVPECKPGVPVGDSRCTPCQYDSTLPSDSPNCVAPPPPTLPNTGAGNTIAIFGGIAVVGFMVYRHILYSKHKAAFRAAELGTSPLPLGQPLDENPLVGTPLESKRSRSFRRKRTY